MTKKATPVGALAPDRSNHAEQVEGQRPDKNQSHVPTGWGR